MNSTRPRTQRAPPWLGSGARAEPCASSHILGSLGSCMRTSSTGQQTQAYMQPGVREPDTSTASDMLSPAGSMLPSLAASCSWGGTERREGASWRKEAWPARPGGGGLPHRPVPGSGAPGYLLLQHLGYTRPHPGTLSALQPGTQNFSRHRGVLRTEELPDSRMAEGAIRPRAVTPIKHTPSPGSHLLSQAHREELTPSALELRSTHTNCLETAEP